MLYSSLKSIVCNLYTQLLNNLYNSTEKFSDTENQDFTSQKFITNSNMNKNRIGGGVTN